MEVMYGVQETAL